MGNGVKKVEKIKKAGKESSDKPELLPELKRVLTECGIEELNELQIRSFEVISEGKNCLVVAPTGSGKTEAAIVPAVNEVLKKGYEPVAIVYVTPLRALNRDVLRRLNRLCKLLGLKVAVRHGDTKKSERSKQSRSAPHLLVTTPETFQLLFLGKRLRKWIENVKFLVIDEVHELFQSKRGVQLSVAVERLREIAKFQTICLSATVRNVKEISAFFSGMREVEVIEGFENKDYSFYVVKPEIEEEDENLAKKLFVDEEVAAQLRFVAELLKKYRSTLIFVNTRQTAEALALKLRKIAEVEVHHGSLSREARLEAERKLLNGEVKALICTSSMELGIDIGHIDCVVQYNSPRQVSRLLQRVGRSGHRAGETSKGVIVVSGFDEIMESWVIAEMAERGELEFEKSHEGSLDTLANQITSMAMEYKGIEARKAFEIVKRAYPYRNLSFDEFIDVCRFLEENGVIGIEENESYESFRIFPRIRTRRYFYDNISMIPDERKYRVIDITSGKAVGVLDEVFVTSFRGEVFAMKGELWRIVDVNDSVKVEPVSGEGEIPSWVGEEIPVPYEVAAGVGELREKIKKMICAFGKEKTVEILQKRFNTNRNACEEVISIIDKTDVVPSDKLITVEQGKGTTVVNSCFGHTVNEVLGRILAMLLSARRGTSISVEVDPYRIKLSPAKTAEVVEILKELKNHAKALKWLAERAMLDTKLFQWKIVSAARKFGILSKNADITRMNIRKFALKLKNTPVYREAVREVFTERFDVDTLEKVVEKLFDEIDVVELSYLGKISTATRSQSFDLLIPSKPTSAILHVFKNRIEKEFCWLYCMNCGCRIRIQVKDVKDSEIRCIRCGSKMIACLNARRKIEDCTKEELMRIANLVMSYGKRAVYAMNTFGVGAENAARILAKFYRNDEEFFKELLEAEKRYIITRKFWKSNE